MTAGLGGMGGAQPLAVKMAGGVCVAVEVDPARAERRAQMGYVDAIVSNPAEAVQLAKDVAAREKTLGVALIGNAAELFSKLRDLGLEPAAVTDQTSAHDPLNGYVPAGHGLAAAVELRARDPDRYIAESMRSMARHVRAMLAFKDDGAIVFEYGNNIRGHAEEAGEARAFEIEGFVPLFIRPNFARGRGPFRWVCLSGDPDDLESHRRGCARGVSGRPASQNLDGDGARARADPGPSGALLLARGRRARPARCVYSTGWSATESSKARSRCRATISTRARSRSRPARRSA